MTERAYSFEQKKWTDIPEGWHQISVGTPTIRGDRYYNCKGEWVETRQPGAPVTVWTVYIRKGPHPWKAPERPRAAQPKAAVLKTINETERPKAARLKGIK